MGKYYKVSEEELIDLLAAMSRMAALDYGGIDNWSWCGDSETEYLCEVMEELGLNREDHEDFSFRDLAKIYLKDYQEVE